MRKSTHGLTAIALAVLCFATLGVEAQARRSKTARLRALTFNIRFDLRMLFCLSGPWETRRSW